MSSNSTTRYKHLRLKRSGDTLWVDMVPGRFPCFTNAFLDDIIRCQYELLEGGFTYRGGSCMRLVLGSALPRIFHYGGDLEYFLSLIKAKDVEGLRTYGSKTVSCIDRMIETSRQGVLTIALLEGNALGGGLECAYSTDIVVAEEGVKLGFPEARFGLYPGMGAGSFLRERVDDDLADQIIREGKVFRAHEAAEMGLVDVLVPKGKGRPWIQSNRHLQRRESRHEGLASEALQLKVAQWAEDAVTLGEDRIRKMEDIVRIQYQFKTRVRLALLRGAASLGLKL